jgi:hypothetical protein
MGVAGEADFLFPIGEPCLRKENGPQRRLALEADHDDPPLPSEEESATDAFPGSLIDYIRADEAKYRHGGVTEE